MPQAYVVYLAVATAVASLLLTSWKIWADRAFRQQLHAFERTERAVRENNERNERLKRESFERDHAATINAEKERAQSTWQRFEAAEREKREAFESSERTLRIRFMAQHDSAQTEAEARIKQEIADYVQLEKWREGAWQRNLARLEQASKDLTGTMSGLVSLIDEGPVYSDARMIQETARALDVFGDFQSSVSHFAMPAEMAELSKELIARITHILLTLSPTQKVRESQQHKALLASLKAELQAVSELFLGKCGEFERNPSALLKG